MKVFIEVQALVTFEKNTTLMLKLRIAIIKMKNTHVSILV